MRVLITGVTGFVGGHLASLLMGMGHEVHGLTRHDIEEVAPEGVITYRADLLDPEAVGRVIEAAAPERIFHLAGASSVGRSFAEPLLTWAVNLNGTLSVLEALRAIGEGHPRAVLVTSGEVYGRVDPADLPVDADTPLRPLSPYAASKAAADLAIGQYRDSWGMDVIRVRAFNQIGPGQDARFVVPSVARQIALAERRGERRVTIRVGNVETRRDFSDVRDIVRAYWLLSERGDPDTVYLACSGRSLPVRELIEGLAALSHAEVTVHSDPGLRREGEQPDLYGSPRSLERDTGWAPAVPLSQSLQDTLDWWRARAAEEEAECPAR